MNIAFIPVRGGSKSIPLKNIKPICGKPLVYWTVKAACGSKYIDRVYVATDSEKIKETVEGFRNGSEAELFSKAIVIDRSAESASDTASTEFAMLEFAEKYEFDNIVLVQARTEQTVFYQSLDRSAFIGQLMKMESPIPRIMMYSIVRADRSLMGISWRMVHFTSHPKRIC